MNIAVFDSRCIVEWALRVPTRSALEDDAIPAAHVICGLSPPHRTSVQAMDSIL